MAVLAVDIGATKFAAAVAVSPIGAVPGDESAAARSVALRHIHQVGVPARDCGRPAVRCCAGWSAPHRPTRRVVVRISR
ncbi:hypothetical protein IRT45_19745 [Nocardia sp. BSTN01]|nr:hypothetical protein [Nocardia sp. BSTN01]MBF4999384.1 hypothetical protein [Nocardia sp. BSTN01]